MNDRLEDGVDNLHTPAYTVAPACAREKVLSPHLLSLSRYLDANTTEVQALGVKQKD